MASGETLIAGGCGFGTAAAPASRPVSAAAGDGVGGGRGGRRPPGDRTDHRPIVVRFRERVVAHWRFLRRAPLAVGTGSSRSSASPISG